MIHVLVQASSRSWQGWEDFCTNPADGKPAAQYTVDKFLTSSPDVKVTLIAPEFDREGLFPKMFESYDPQKFNVHFSHDDSPLLRMISATEALNDDDYFIRVDGLHFAVLEEESIDMLQQAMANNVDCMKFPDDFPIQFTADVYRVGALRTLAKQNPTAAFSVHPKYAFINEPNKWQVGYILPPIVKDDYLNWARSTAKSVYVARTATNKNSKIVGDLHTFHYDIAKEYIKNGDLVLDCSCGDGTGSHILSSTEKRVIGGDIDRNQIAIAKSKMSKSFNGEFQQTDIMSMPYDTNQFDVVVCIETIEHVDEIKCLTEIKRVLKPNGILLISTPQNSLGKIPINPMHNKEYSLQELTNTCNQYFNVEETIGIKQGRIIIRDSYKGSNMMLICRNDKNISL